MSAGPAGQGSNGPDIDVVVVAADSGALLEACIDSVLVSPLPRTVILFDNASSDGMPQRTAAKHGGDARLRLLHGERNLGFGAAVNRAARQIESSWLLVLNPDAMLSTGCLERLLAEATARPRAGLVGAVMVDPQGTPDPASQRRDPLLARTLAQLGLGRGERVNVDQPIAAHTIEVEAVSGALMLIRRSVFDALGGFDEGYFLHFEDLDLCRRVRDAGWQVLLAGDVQVVHRQGSSSRHRPIFVDWHKHRGMWRWFRQHDPAAQHGWLRVLVALAISAHFTLRTPLLAWRLLRRSA